MCDTKADQQSIQEENAGSLLTRRVTHLDEFLIIDLAISVNVYQL